MRSAPVEKILVLAPMRSELQPVVRALGLGKPAPGPVALRSGRVGSVNVVATTAGVGPVAAARSTEIALAAAGPDHVIVCGIAGAVDASATIGEVILPDVVVDGATGEELLPSPLGSASLRGRVMTTADLIVDPAALGRLLEEGVDALEMESAAIGRVCDRAGLPWTVVRSISDRAGDGIVDVDVLSMLNEDGSANVTAALKQVLAHPGRIPALARLARDSAVAVRAAAEATKSVVSSV